MSESRERKADQALDELLRSLPRVRASEGFTEKVLRAAATPRSARAGRRWLLGLATAGLLLILAGGAALWIQQASRKAALRDEIARLQAEQAELQVRLAELREQGGGEELEEGREVYGPRTVVFERNQNGSVELTGGFL
jgi:hypothetical protein